MVSVKKSETAHVAVTIRLPLELAGQVERLLKATSASMASFTREAIEHEISRRTLCKPAPVVTLESLSQQLHHLATRLEKYDVQHRMAEQTLNAVAAAVGTGA